MREFLTGVIKDLTHVHFYEYDTRLRGTIMGLLERPVQEMRDNREIQETIRVQQGTLHRRLHDLEFVMQKFQKSANLVEMYQERVEQIESAMDIKKKDIDRKILKVE